MAESGDVSITPAAPRSMAGIGALRDRKRLLEALQAEFGAAAPMTPGFIQAGGVILACLAPTRFLAIGERGARLPARLAHRLAGLGAVTDQSDQWQGWKLSGPLVREVLARVVPIDLAPARFRPGDLALTRAGHLDVQLWRIDDDCYEIAVTRSYAADLAHALAMAGGGGPRPR